MILYWNIKVINFFFLLWRSIDGYLESFFSTKTCNSAVTSECKLTDKENFPIVGLEAMSCGSIVLAHFNGFSEYIDNEVNGFLIGSVSTNPEKFYSIYEQF